jgi:hydroxyacylglutathione hydrolase
MLFPIYIINHSKSWSLFFLQYSAKNLQFALTIEPENLKIQQKLTWAKNQRQAGQPTIPSTIEEELETNPFMRVDLPVIQVCHLFNSSKCYTK